MTILSAAWTSPALHHPTIDPRPALLLWGQRRAAVIERRGNMLAFDITTRPDAPMKCWRSIDQLKTLNSESEIKKAVKAMSETYKAVKDDVVLLESGDIAKVLEVLDKTTLRVLTTAGDEIRITQDDISGQMLNVEFKLANDAHIGSLTAAGLDWNSLPSGDAESEIDYLDEELAAVAAVNPSAIYSDDADDYITGDDDGDGLIDPAVAIRDDEPAPVDNQIVVDTVLNGENPYIDQITKLQKALQAAETKNSELEEAKFKATREAEKAKQELADATRQRADEFTATKQKLADALAEIEKLKKQTPTPAASSSGQGFLPYFNRVISTPDQAAAAGRELAALRAEGWRIKHEQFIQDGKMVCHVARLEKVEREPSHDPLLERVAVPVPADVTGAEKIFSGIIPAPKGDPANNSAPDKMVIIGLDDDKPSLDPFAAALKAGITDPDTLRQIGDQQLMRVARSSYQRNVADPISRRPLMQVQE